MVGRCLLLIYAFEIVIRPTDFFVPGVSLFFIFAILGLLIPDNHMVPDKDRSSPHIFLPDAYGEGRSLSGFWLFLAV